MSIPVKDQTVALDFYTKLLGFDVIRNEPMGPQMRWIQLAPPGATTTISLVTWFEEMKPGNVRGLLMEDRRRFGHA